MNKWLFSWMMLLFSPFLYGEVELVTITWNPLICQDQCLVNLEKRMASLSQVSSVEMHGAEGRMDLVWNPTIPFSFIPINIGLRYVGVRERTVGIKVRGRVQGSGKEYSIISDGDHTHFVLINQVNRGNSPETIWYDNQFNAEAANRELSQEQVDLLSKALKKGATTTVEGILFMPHRSPPMPLRIVIGSISFEETDKTAPGTPKKSTSKQREPLIYKS